MAKGAKHTDVYFVTVKNNGVTNKFYVSAPNVEDAIHFLLRHKPETKGGKVVDSGRVVIPYM